MDSESMLQVRLITKQEKFNLPEVNHTVPKNVNVTSLNETVNRLLKETCSNYLKPVVFDFIVEGELMRKTLEEHLIEKSVTNESVVDIEYIQKIPTPVREESVSHDDWVSSIHICAGKWILTGCYDNSVYLWNTSRKSIVPLGHHSDIVRDVKWINILETEKGFVSVSYDQTAVLWNWEEGTQSANPICTLKGHLRGIDCVGISPNSEKVATGSRDTNLKIWSATLENEDEPVSKKSKTSTNHYLRTPICTLQGHKEAVTTVEWLDNENIISSSMDHTIKVWDIQMARIKNEIVGHKAFLSSSWSSLANALLTSSADQYIRLYDPRLDHCECKSLYKSHTQWVSSVKWSPNSEHLFVSGGYDKKVKMWDIRCTKEHLFDVHSHDGQVLNLDWSDENYIFSSGTDNYVHMFRNESLT